MKTCKFCAEEIQDAARICPHCRKWQPASFLQRALWVLLMLLGVILLAHYS